MLIDAFSNGWMEELDARANCLDPSDQLFLLIDGAFIPGLHQSLPADRKVLLFALLPASNEASEAASPFLIPYERSSRQQRALFQRCSRWPMLSAITTSESCSQLAARLAGWCVVEADGQRFNFRFPDTRRLPAIYGTLTAQQRAAFSGPIKQWSYIGRNGKWDELPITGNGEYGEEAPILDKHQFAILIDDSRADELMVLLRDRGHDVFRSPSRSYTLLSIALRAALAVELDDRNVPSWCEWVWQQDKFHDDTGAKALLQSWQKNFHEGGIDA